MNITQSLAQLALELARIANERDQALAENAQLKNALIEARADRTEVTVDGVDAR